MSKASKEHGKSKNDAKGAVWMKGTFYLLIHKVKTLVRQNKK
jgi:hypothetical protein